MFSQKRFSMNSDLVTALILPLCVIGLLQIYDNYRISQKQNFNEVQCSILILNSLIFEHLLKFKQHDDCNKSVIILSYKLQIHAAVYRSNQKSHH